MMHFWGIEVKHGASVKVKPRGGMILHISQACLGDIKKDKGNDYFRLFAEANGQKFVIGILSSEKFPHVNLDLVFEDEFKLSHDLKQGSVHFIGYEVQNPSESISEDESDDDLDELVPVDTLNNGKPESKASKATANWGNGSEVKSDKTEGKPKVKIVEPNKDAKDEDDDDTEDDDEDEDMPSAEAGSDEDDSDEEDDSEEEDDSDEEEDSDDETPEKKPVPSKKRRGESTSRTPGAEKKAKFSTPEKKTDGKKASSVHVATPHPAKQAAKTPANAGKADKQASKSGGSISCTSCSRSFGSQQALDSHSKAKHGGK